MADEHTVEEQLGVLSVHPIEPGAAFHPVVALVAEHHVGTISAEQEVISRTGEDFAAPVLTSLEEIHALAAEQQIDPARGHNDVIPLVAAQHVIAERILDDVVA